MLKLVFFAGLSLAVTPAVAQTQSAPTAPATKTAPAKDDPNRVICETQEQIGSRLAAKRICMTAAQWKEHEQQVRGQIDQMHSQVQATGSPG